MSMSAKFALGVVVSSLEVGVGGWELNRFGFFVVFFDARFGRTGVIVLDDVDGPHRAWKPAALP